MKNFNEMRQMFHDLQDLRNETRKAKSAEKSQRLVLIKEMQDQPWDGEQYTVANAFNYLLGLLHENGISVKWNENETEDIRIKIFLMEKYMHENATKDIQNELTQQH